MTARLNVNIDHVATVRQARRAPEPGVVAAAVMCELAGADGITVHLRGDRRHVQDMDLRLLRQTVTTYLNVEMAVTDEMIAIALEVKPDAVTFVAEKPEEITTEGGLEVRSNLSAVKAAVGRLRNAGIITSLFVDPDEDQIAAALAADAQQVELCTAQYANATLGCNALQSDGEVKAAQELQRLHTAALLGTKSGLRVAAGHGLTYRNVGLVAAIAEITEFNIGHNIVARSIFVGLDAAVREMIAALRCG